MGCGAGPDLLVDRVFTVQPAAEALTLPELLARLLAGPEVESFPEVAPEQRSYWWRFLVRCAAKGLQELALTVAQAAATEPAALAEALRGQLAALVPAGGWCLYQPDPALPGFLQVPVPGGSLDGYKPRGISSLTGALGQKNHERKSAAVRSLTSEQTVYALVEYQTAANYGGVGNYGSQLQGSASGAGSGTPFMGARIAASEQQSFRHDVGVMLSRRPSGLSDHGGHIWALWALPWSGAKTEALLSTGLDPTFIPLARLIRLASPTDGLFATLGFHGTEGARVADHTGGGVLGDPFTPLVSEPKLKVRGTLDTGYNYTEVVGLLFGGEKHVGPSPSVAALIDQAELERCDLSVVFEGVAYEQGKTVGFHHREVLLPAVGGIGLLANPAPVRTVHTALLRLVKDAKSALRGATRIVLAGTPSPRDTDRPKTDRVANRLDARVDAAYLGHLFAAAERHQSGDLEYAADWLAWLQAATWHTWREALAGLPCNTNQRLERELRAESYLQRKLRALAGEADEPPGEQETSAP